MTMNTLKTIACAGLLLAGMAATASAGVVVVGNNQVNGELSAEQVRQLFLGKSRTLPNGTAAVVLDLREGDPLRVTFVEQVLGKTEQQLLGHWAKMIFTGKGQPPQSVANSREVLRIVESTPGAVGYIDEKQLTAQVKVLYRMP
jgi:ABC-type phosphate transport system substrate-binding protein